MYLSLTPFKPRDFDESPCRVLVEPDGQAMMTICTECRWDLSQCRNCASKDKYNETLLFTII